MSIELKVFLACIAIQLLYYLLLFGRLNFVRPFKITPEFLPPASIIICARNEAENLRRYLKVVLIQQYNQYEVIVVNDRSDDDTIEVLVEYYKRNKNLKIIQLDKSEPKEYAGKKDALMRGIEAAVFDTIVVTDADCRPATTHWLARLVGSYLHDTQIVLGHAPYEKHPGFLNKLIRYENSVTALLYFGFARAGLPYMGVGRNLSYKKELQSGFERFEKNKNILTGDDDLFINAVANSKNTEICIDKEAFTFSQPEQTFTGWLNQKRRHLRSGFRYKLVHRFLLFLFALSKFGLYISFIILMAKAEWLKVVLCTLAGFLMLALLITFRVFKKLGSEDLRFLFPLLDVCYTVYLVLIFFLLLLKPKDVWKT